MNHVTPERCVFDRLKNFQEADRVSVEAHNKKVCDTLVPALEQQLRTKAHGVGQNAVRTLLF
jgi:hypothetical protein